MCGWRFSTTTLCEFQLVFVNTVASCLRGGQHGTVANIGKLNRGDYLALSTHFSAYTSWVDGVLVVVITVRAHDPLPCSGNVCSNMGE